MNIPCLLALIFVRQSGFRNGTILYWLRNNSGSASFCPTDSGGDFGGFLFGVLDHLSPHYLISCRRQNFICVYLVPAWIAWARPVIGLLTRPNGKRPHIHRPHMAKSCDHHHYPPELISGIQHTKFEWKLVHSLNSNGVFMSQKFSLPSSNLAGMPYLVPCDHSHLSRIHESKENNFWMTKERTTSHL